MQTKKQMELSPAAFAIRRSGSDIVKATIARLKEINGSNQLPGVAKFRMVDEMADEISHLIGRLSTTLSKLDEEAAKNNPQNNE